MQSETPTDSECMVLAGRVKDVIIVSMPPGQQVQLGSPGSTHTTPVRLRNVPIGKTAISIAGRSIDVSIEEGRVVRVRKEERGFFATPGSGGISTPQ